MLLTMLWLFIFRQYGSMAGQDGAAGGRRQTGDNGAGSLIEQGIRLRHE